MPEDDVATALGELERKLKDLEDELQSVPRGAPGDDALPEVAPPAPALAPNLALGAGASPSRAPLVATVAAPSELLAASAPEPATVADPPPAASPAPVPPDETPSVASAQPDSAGLPSQVEELVRFREQLERSAREFMAEYERVLDSLRATTDAALATATHLSARPAPAKAPDTATAPPQTAPSAGHAGLDGTILDGVVAVEAGPFSNIATLSGFEQALGSVPGVCDVYVRGFQGSRAHIDVTLGQPIALAAELRRTAQVAFTIVHASSGRLSVAIEPGA